MHRNFLPFVPYRFHGRTVPCPVCASARHTLIARIDRRLKPLTTVMCDDCGLFYSNPMPTDAELSNYYKNEYRRDYQLAFLKPSARHVGKKRREAVERYGVIRDEARPTRLRTLDFGCGSGELVHECAQRGHEAHGFEPGETYARFAGRNGLPNMEIRDADHKQADYAEKHFDVVTMLHVLEHIPEPIAALRAANRWLKDDGFLYVEVPNMQAYDFKGFERFHFAHVLGFSRDNLIHALRLAGFRVRREIAGTSIIAEKCADRACEASIDLVATADRNRREYTTPVSWAGYLAHHVKRLARRTAGRLRAPARPPKSSLSSANG